jgi:hypothetical protein
MASIGQKKKSRLKEMAPSGPSEQLDLDAVGKEIIDSALEAFNEELAASSPALKNIAKEFSFQINEFFEGFREGVTAEIEVFKQQLAEQNGLSPNLPTDIPTSLPLDPFEEKKQRTQEEIKKELQELNKGISNTVLGRDLIPQEKKKGFGKLSGAAGQFGIGLLGGLTSFMGGEKWAENKISANSEMSAFVEAETKLRSKSDPEGFGSMSRKEQKKLLKTDFKEIKKAEKELGELESQADKYRRAGYSEEQINMIGDFGSKRDKLTDTLAKHDVSRTKKDLGLTEEEAHEQNLLREKEFDEVEKQTTLLTEIKNLLSGKKQPEATPANGGAGIPSLPMPGLPGGPPGKGGFFGKLASGAKNLGKALVSPKGIAAMAVVGGAYTAYSGYKGANKESEAKMAEIDAAEKSGQLSKEEAETQRQQVAAQTTENKGGAVGKGTGMAAGAIGGAKVGAMLGSFAGPVGTVVGGLAGGALGAVAGSSVGQNIGGMVGKGVAGVKSMFGMGTPTTATGEPVLDADGDKKQQAMKYFESKGYTKEQAAGLVGNLMAESGNDLKTDAVGDGGKAYGIAQWHPDRQAKFKEVFGKDIREASFKDQLEFIEWELNNTEKRAGKKLRESKTAEEAATNVDKFYERSSGEHRDKRISLAKGLMENNEFDSSKSVYASLDGAGKTNQIGAKLEQDAIRSEGQKQNIIVQAPQAAPMQSSSKGETQIVPQPFTNMIKNREPSVSDYLRSRYA